MPRNDGAILAHLNAGGVEFVVIGGWAVIAHGYVRATGDVAGVKADAESRMIDGTEVLVSGLAHLVAFKRLANRLTDRADLEELERILQRPLPRLALPGIDD